MDCLRYTDATLLALHYDLAREIHRRTQAATSGCDAATIIRGQEMVKRAIVVAAAGGHSLLLVGPPASGKTLLRGLALALTVNVSAEAWPCPCGHHGDPRVACRCEAEVVAAHVARLPRLDIVIEVMTVPYRELAGQRPGTGLAEMWAQVRAAEGYAEGAAGARSDALDQDGNVLLKAAYSELGYTPLDVEVVKRVARTIANLDRSENVKSHHVCEAINYRLRRF